MGKTLTAIRFDRLLLALAITFLVVDTYPHPSLGPGLVESFSRWGLANLTVSGNRLQPFIEP